MVLLVSLVPLYIFIPEFLLGRTLHVPEVALDRVIPLQPAWALIYGSLYLFLIVLPVLIVRQAEQIRRTVYAYLLVWLTAYVCCFVYPTAAPRRAEVVGDGFIVWSLRFLYSADVPYNCFPSLHVAHSFVSALTCYRLHRGVGIAATFSAVLVGLSTLFHETALRARRHRRRRVGRAWRTLFSAQLFARGSRRSRPPCGAGRGHQPHRNPGTGRCLHVGGVSTERARSVLSGADLGTSLAKPIQEEKLQ